MDSMFELGRQSGREWKWSTDQVPGGPWGITEKQREEYREGWRIGLAERDAAVANGSAP